MSVLGVDMCCVCSSSGVSEGWGKAGLARVPYQGQGGRAPAQEAAHTKGDMEPKVHMEELNGFGHQPAHITQQHLVGVRSPSVFVSPFCCS